MVKTLQAIHKSASSNKPDVGPAESEEHPPIFVGIHIRRADYRKWMQFRLGANLLDEKYFFRAAKIMREKIWEKEEKERGGLTDMKQRKTKVKLKING